MVCVGVSHMRRGKKRMSLTSPESLMRLYLSNGNKHDEPQSSFQGLKRLIGFCPWDLLPPRTIRP